MIGYVGMTGLATGPHLHYEYLMNGVHMNPQTVRLPGAEPLRADALVKFHSTATPLLSSLANPPQPAAASTSMAAAPQPATPQPAAPTTAASVAPQSLSDTQSKTSVN